jgi:LysR substrate binding domain-containing protein
VHEARDTGTLLGLVAAGVGCAVLPQSVRDGAASGVVVRPLRGAGKVEFAMVWRRREPRRRVRSVVTAVLRHVGLPPAVLLDRITADPATPCAPLDPRPRVGRRHSVPLVSVTRRATGDRARSTAVTTPGS